jgi:hypothetical protein
MHMAIAVQQHYQEWTHRKRTLPLTRQWNNRRITGIVLLHCRVQRGTARTCRAPPCSEGRAPLGPIPTHHHLSILRPISPPFPPAADLEALSLGGGVLEIQPQSRVMGPSCARGA